jgi:hypothetical protein
MSYIDGFVAAVPQENQQAYLDPRPLVGVKQTYFSVMIRRFSSNSVLSISPRAKRSFRISIAVEEVSRLFSRASVSLSPLVRRAPQHEHHMIVLHLHFRQSRSFLSGQLKFIRI